MVHLKPSINCVECKVAEIPRCRPPNREFVSLARATGFGLVPRMPRRFRVQYEDALYHLINRGNYRLPGFATAGAAHSFETTLGEASEVQGWWSHAHAVMRNLFHLALETPRPIERGALVRCLGESVARVRPR